MPVKTKTTIGILLCVYFFSHSFTQWIFGYTPSAYAADEAHENIIAVIVDKNIYDKYRNDIDRYAQEYLQSQNTDTKALLLPLNKDNFKAYDIRKLLENLYQEGDKERTSSLIGTILIGDIPLPVIRENNYIYPSVYPYTDLSKPSYVYEPGSTYFVPQEAGDHKADIWQSVISFTQEASYPAFFNKLKSYKENPSNYTSTKVWYEDFIGLKKYFSDQFISGYINNFLFHEDITYHRFTNLLLDYFKKQSELSTESLFEQYNTAATSNEDDAYEELGKITSEFSSTVDTRRSMLNKL